MKKREKMIKDFQKFLEENYEEDMTQEDLTRLVKLYNYRQEFNEQDTVDSDDYLEMAYQAETEKDAIKYTKKALKLDPDNTDAETYLITLTSKNMYEIFSRYKEALDKCRDRLEKEGFFEEENKGHFWGIVETRPYIRLWYHYVDALIDMGMINQAIEEVKEILLWNESDNCGGRYYLAHLYAYRQDEEALLHLHKQYDEYDETQFLLPKSILYYKNNDFKNAEKYLRKVEECNPDIKLIFNPDKLEKKLNKETDLIYGAYRPGTYQELLMEVEQFAFLFESVPYYFEWAESVLKKKKTTLH